MTTKLTVGDRIALLGVLPREGTIEKIRLVHELRQDLSFSEDDLERLKIQRTEKEIRWDMSADGEGREYEFGDAAAGVVRDKLQELSKSGKLTEELIDSWDKFHCSSS